MQLFMCSARLAPSPFARTRLPGPSVPPLPMFIKIQRVRMFTSVISCAVDLCLFPPPLFFSKMGECGSGIQEQRAGR